MPDPTEPHTLSGLPGDSLDGHRERFERLHASADLDEVWVCPEEWDLGPREYRTLLRTAFDAPEPLGEAMAPALPPAAGALGIVAAAGALSVVDVPASVEAILATWGFPVGLLAMVMCLLFSAAYTYGAVTYRHSIRIDQAEARERLTWLDAAQVLALPLTSGSDLEEFEACVDAVIESPALFPEDRQEILSALYRAAVDGGPEAYEAAVDAAVDVLDRQAPATPLVSEARLAHLVGRGAGVGAGRGAEQHPPVDPVTTKKVPDATGANQWADPVHRHDQVAEAWTAMITDPLNALSHAALFDVTQPRTAAFIEAYGAVQDFRSIHAITPHGPTAGAETTDRGKMLIKYVTLVRQATTAWDEAKRYSERVRWDWLPEHEATAARKAAGLLALAADESATFHERATAAAKAQTLLREISTVMLPEATLSALEARARLSIEPRLTSRSHTEAPGSVSVQTGPDFRPTRYAVNVETAEPLI